MAAELEIFKHKDWLASLLEYYADTKIGRNDVSHYVGDSLWQKSFFGWCHDQHGLTTFTDVVRTMFGTERKYGYVLAFMEENLTLDIVRRHYKSCPIIEVE